ncbi:hypothetical protein [Microbacterium sp. MPKO10]|uniref:hypothetical protein n=1 Tax=Microbacterium sp. MPKO10 TaxID=2989818 RepID=UPI0022367E0B|nr:hypothetical protein [Microbacterium sp. MPKO10]MCW4460001.1 hypothetical protein [Microbacterium sp. MPKO10]
MTMMRMLATTAIVAMTLLAGSAAASAVMPGAVDPVRSRQAANEVTIGQDGSYQVVLSEKVEMRAEAHFSFGGTVHDGFRLSDDGSVIPPYLRAEYAAPESTIDGAAVSSAFEVQNHAVSIAVGDDFDEGTHRGAIRYDVTSAAVPTADGYVVYVRPIALGETTITATDAIASVECVGIPPDAAECGHETADAWVIGADEFGIAGVVKITLAGDPDGVADAHIDRG